MPHALKVTWNCFEGKQLFSCPQVTSSFSCLQVTLSFSCPQVASSFSCLQVTLSFSCPQVTSSFFCPQVTSSFSCPQVTSSAPARSPAPRCSVTLIRDGPRRLHANVTSLLQSVAKTCTCSVRLNEWFRACSMLLGTSMGVGRGTLPLWTLKLHIFLLTYW